MNSRLHACIGTVIERLLWPKNKYVSETAMQVLMGIVSIRPWIAVPVLSFPVSFSYNSISGQDN